MLLISCEQHNGILLTLLTGEMVEFKELELSFIGVSFKMDSKWLEHAPALFEVTSSTEKLAGELIWKVHKVTIY